MKYERIVSSASDTEMVENPFRSFVNTNISDVKQKATRLSDNYMLNFGGGFSSMSTKEKSSRQQLVKQMFGRPTESNKTV